MKEAFQVVWHVHGTLKLKDIPEMGNKLYFEDAKSAKTFATGLMRIRGVWYVGYDKMSGFVEKGGSWPMASETLL